MNKARGLSIIAITLLILQMFSVNFGMGTISKAAHNEPKPKVEVKNKSVDDDTLTWEVAVSALSDEEATAKTNITFNSGQSHKAIDHKEGITADQTKDGYVIETPTDGTTHIVQLTTTVTDESQEKFQLSAETKLDGNTYNDEAQVEVEGKSEAPEPEQDNDAQTSEQSTESEQSSSSKEKSEGTNEEDEYIPVEQYGNQSGGKAKAFSLNNFKAMQTVGEGTATHKIKKATSDNMCLRELDGEINLTLPKPEVKTPVDIVVVQDASGSYGGNANQARRSLRDIVDMLDLSQDRMMVTSYRGYNGWNSYNNLTAFKSGSVRSRNNDLGTQQRLQTRNHTGLSNNPTTLKNGINQIAFDGATPTASGLQYAKDQYATATAGQDLSGRKTVFILITDGVANAMLDGRIHIQHGAGSRGVHEWAERHQFYQETFSQVVGVADSIKSEGYTMVSAYWENTSILRDAYPNYNTVIGPAARQMVRNVASGPEFFNTNENLAQAMADLIANLQTTLNEYNGFQTEFDIAPGFELVADSIYVNGNKADYTISGNTVTVTANKIKSGESTMTYKLKETVVHGGETTPVSNGTIKYDKENNSFKGSIEIPNVNLSGNENSEQCVTNINKAVALKGSSDFTERIDLDQLGDIFTYKVEYQFGENIGQYDQVQLKDELESVLSLVNDITISSNVDPHVLVQNTILDNQSGFIVDIQKHNDSFDYLAGKTVTVTFDVSVREGVTNEDLKDYFETGIPNVAQLLLDGEPDDSNEVYVGFPKKGSLTVKKVDENGEPLAGAEFTLTGPGGYEEAKTSEANGEIAFDDLELGSYTLVETKAPIGYRLLTGEISIEINEDDLHITKTVENSLQGWEIPKTGGIGSLGFLGAGFMLMAGAGWFVYRRRYV